MELTATAKRVVVFDYGFGNVRSAERALARAGADVEITGDYDKAMNADGLLVPGVGAFAACMDGLKAARGDQVVDRRLSGGRPVMGICVGMQILFARGIEHDVEAEGLDEWPGTVGPPQADIVPHMGWNTVDAPADSQLFAGLDADARFYFVHSYAVHDWTQESHNPLIAAPRSPGPRTASRSWRPWRTAPCGPPSSTPRSPATPGPSSSPTGSRPCRDEQARTPPRRRRPRRPGRPPRARRVRHRDLLRLPGWRPPSPGSAPVPSGCTSSTWTPRSAPGTTAS